MLDKQIRQWINENRPLGLTGISVLSKALGLMNGQVYVALVSLERQGWVKMVRTPDGQHWFVPNEASYYEHLPICYVNGEPQRYLRQDKPNSIRLVAKPHDPLDTLYDLPKSMEGISFSRREG